MTGTPIEASEGLSPEWLRVSSAVRIYGVGRSTLYEAMQCGEIEFRTLRQRNRVKPMRLISYDSLKRWFDNATRDKVSYSVAPVKEAPKWRKASA